MSRCGATHRDPAGFGLRFFICEQDAPHVGPHRHVRDGIAHTWTNLDDVIAVLHDDAALARDPGDEHSEPTGGEPQQPAVPALLAIIDAQHAALVRVRERQAKAFAKPAEQRELWDACELANGAMPWR